MGKDIRDMAGGGDPVEGAARPKSTGDRRCAQCGIRLSLYNPGPHCWQHTMGWPWRGPSAKPRF